MISSFQCMDLTYLFLIYSYFIFVYRWSCCLRIKTIVLPFQSVCQLSQVFDSLNLLRTYWSSINYWKRDVEISDFDYGFVYFSLQFYSFFSLSIWKLCYSVHKHLELLCGFHELTPLSLWSDILYIWWYSLLWNLLCLI